MGMIAARHGGAPVALLALLVGLLCLLPCPALPSDDKECAAAVPEFFDKHSFLASSPNVGTNMVFFLHIPRTAGRTFHACFLIKGTAHKDRCPNSWDNLLRINMEQPNCRLLSSHDDYSVVSMLPRDVSVLTQIRDPVDRFLSAYQFAVEQAAREMKRKRPVNPNKKQIATRDVWPWTHLLSFFVRDMNERVAKLEGRSRHDAAEGGQHPGGASLATTVKHMLLRSQAAPGNSSLAPLDPHNNPLVMPLEEFVDHPIAAELLHNGQTFQVLGITNNSRWQGTGQMRRCSLSSSGAQRRMLEVALGRLGSFIHVGVTNKLEDSAAAAGAAMHFNLSQPALAGGNVYGPKKRPGRKPLQRDMTAGVIGPSLGHMYQVCMRDSRKRRATNHKVAPTVAMQDGRELRFTAESRKKIPEAVLEKIRSRNTLDTALHQEAEKLLRQHREEWSSLGKLQVFPVDVPTDATVAKPEKTVQLRMIRSTRKPETNAWIV